MMYTDLTSIPIRADISTPEMLRICEYYMGFVYLQDYDFPTIGLMPNGLFIQSAHNTCLMRDTKFEYKSINKPFYPEFSSSKIKNNCLRFTGGYIGFISYDCTSHQYIQSNIKQPSMIFGEYDIYLQKIDQQWHLFCPTDFHQHSSILKLLDQMSHIQVRTAPKRCYFNQKFQPRWSKAEYALAFNQIKNYLYAGDCYQVNLTQEFCTTMRQGSLLPLLTDLLNLTKAPYAGYLAFDDFELLSCSPELFLEFGNERLLKTRPIKGTLPRSTNPTQDQQLKQQLFESKKDQAENLMIVDLLRNDLSIYAEIGSVKTPQLFEIESFAQVHHMVSEIHATLKPDVNPFDVLMSALPGGSITGAPKIRAMQIIDEIEGNTRGAYCGSLGYFNYDGTGRFNILIRTIQRYGDAVSVWAGGGITVASNVDAEYQETLDKVSAILDLLNQYADDSTTH